VETWIASLDDVAGPTRQCRRQKVAELRDAMGDESVMGRRKPRGGSTIRNILDATKAIEQMAATHAEGHDCLICKAANGDGQAQAIILLELKKRGHDRAMDLP
jgi:hypothetical protein